MYNMLKEMDFNFNALFHSVKSKFALKETLLME